MTGWEKRDTCICVCRKEREREKEREGNTAQNKNYARRTSFMKKPKLPPLPGGDFCSQSRWDGVMDSSKPAT